jgi:hypothetical protein
MHLFRGFIAAILCCVLPVAACAADDGYKVVYDGGSLQGMKAGTDVKLYIGNTNIRLSRDKTDIVTLPANSVTEISYGQDVHRRVGAAIGLAVISFGIGALMALTKSKKHFIGLTWADGEKKGGLAMQCDKKEYRGILSGLEGVTGKKAVDSDALTVKNWRRYDVGVRIVGTLPTPIARIVFNQETRATSTSFAERQNLSVRMGLRRYTRLTNAFSRKIENHSAAVALYYFAYNFIKIHGTLRCTPAMAAGVTDRLWEVSNLVALLEAKERELPRAA